MEGPVGRQGLIIQSNHVRSQSASPCRLLEHWPRPKSVRLVTGRTSSASATTDQMVAAQDRLITELENLRALLQIAQQPATPQPAARLVRAWRWVRATG